MAVASKNERTATMKVTRPPERPLGPIQGTDRLMTMAEVSDLLGIPISTLYGWRHRGEGRPVTGSGAMFDFGGRRSRPGSRRAPTTGSGSDMSGFVEKRSTGRWRARYRGPDGRERSKTFDRRVDADRWLAGVSFAMARGEWTDPARARVTVGDWSRQWLTAKAHSLKATTPSRTGRS